MLIIPWLLSIISIRPRRCLPMAWQQDLHFINLHLLFKSLLLILWLRHIIRTIHKSCPVWLLMLRLLRNEQSISLAQFLLPTTSTVLHFRHHPSDTSITCHRMNTRSQCSYRSRRKFEIFSRYSCRYDLHQSTPHNGYMLPVSIPLQSHPYPSMIAEYSRRPGGHC